MKLLIKKTISLTLTAFMIIIVIAPAYAITAAPSDKNTESRHINATSLSEQAKAYYRDEVKEYISDDDVYSSFVDLADNNSGNGSGTSYDAAKNNDLFTALYNIMSSTHTHGVSYGSYGSNSLAHYWLTTDTSYANKDDDRDIYTFFYSDVDCVNHENMQREHIWPKSKASFYEKTGLGGSDLHHLRPSYAKVNNIKSNWGFGNTKQFSNAYQVQWPEGVTSLWKAEIDSENNTFIDVKDDIRGDVARILLYVYTRWRQPNLYSDIVNTDGTPDTSKLPELDPDDSKNTGERVIQSKDVLLCWMKNDPVSEWEMKRNDLTENIQGNRNVFIDYPELAWLLFDSTVPNDMVTPSGMAQNTEADIPTGESQNPTDPVTIDIGTINNGIAEITVYDNTIDKPVKNGDTVERGDSLTYTVKPDESTIDSVREYKTDDNNKNYRQIAKPDMDTEYSFTKQAGCYNGSPNTGYDKERIRVSLKSKVCEFNYKIKSVTASGNNGGSGSGMVTAKIKGTNTTLDNGAVVPNGTEVTLTFTPGYGSRFYGLTYNNKTQSADGIDNTDSYTYTAALDCSDNSARIKTFNVKFAQTFNTTGEDSYKHIYNNGMRPDADDEWGAETDFTGNFEICGVQIKHFDGDKENKALRFVSVIDRNILDKAESYGYVIGYSDNNTDRKTINRNAFTLVKDGESGLTIDCTGTDNNTFGDYGKHNTNKNYKYITAAVNNIQDAEDIGVDTTIIARPYVELKDEYKPADGPAVIYGQYTDASTGEAYPSCSCSYNYIARLEREQ